MKTKIGLALAVVLLGAFAVVYAQAKEETVESASTPVSSSAPVATEEPAASMEPTAGDDIEDTSLAQPVKQEVVDHGPSNQDATYETETALEQKISAQGEQWIQDMMSKWGISREEAEKAYRESEQRGQQAAAAEQQIIADRNEAYKEFSAQQAEEAKEAADAHYYERYGISRDEADGMSSEELWELHVQKIQQGG